MGAHTPSTTTDTVGQLARPINRPTRRQFASRQRVTGLPERAENVVASRHSRTSRTASCLLPERSPVGHYLDQPVGFDPAQRGNDGAARYPVLGGELGDGRETLAKCPQPPAGYVSPTRRACSAAGRSGGHTPLERRTVSPTAAFGRHGTRR